jgi:hypothetical protein
VRLAILEFTHADHRRNVSSYGCRYNILHGLDIETSMLGVDKNKVESRRREHSGYLGATVKLLRTPEDGLSSSRSPSVQLIRIEVLEHKHIEVVADVSNFQFPRRRELCYFGQHL